MQLHCVVCGANSLRGYCFRHKPRKPLQAKKRIRRVGKVGQKLLDQRKAYFEDHPGDEHYCYYCVFVGIEVALTQAEAQVEHFMSKARHPELRFERSNLIVSCGPHNERKGSLDGLEFLKILEEEHGRN